MFPGITGVRRVPAHYRDLAISDHPQQPARGAGRDPRDGQLLERHL